MEAGPNPAVACFDVAHAGVDVCATRTGDAERGQQQKNRRANAMRRDARGESTPDIE